MSVSTARSIEHPIGAEGVFVLQLGSGDVRVRGVDGDVARVEDRRGVDIVNEFEIETGESSFALRARKGLRIKLGPGRRDTPSLDVRVPHRATVVVETASGDIAAEDLDGEQRFQSSSGDIELVQVSGSVVIEAVSGDVEVIAADPLRLQARTVSGDLDVRAGELAELSASTTSGDLAIAGELRAEGTYKVETVSGDATLALAGGVRIDVSTVTGDLSADVPHRVERTDGRRVMIVGDGSARLAVETMSGDVRVAKARRPEVVIRPGVRRPAQEASRAASEPPETAAPLAPASEPAAAPTPPEPETPSSPSDSAIAAAYEDARLTILRSVERGEIDVAEAGRRLEALDAAGIPEETTRD